jgi:outer membrane immunogenic protein
MSRLRPFDLIGQRMHVARIAVAVCATLAVSSADRALAADWLGDSGLRGSLMPTNYARWDGWQFGLQAGFGNMNTDFGNSTSSLIAFILRNTELEAEAAPSNWTTLPKSATNGPVFGGFVGYNMQWAELVIGWDLSYQYASILQSSADATISRLVTTSADNVQHAVTITSSSKVKLVDYATLRARAGYAVGNFLPYAVIGLAAGRFNYSTTVSLSDTQTFPTNPPGVVPFSDSASAGKTNSIVGGVAGGLGVDWAVTPNVFLRAEWEYIAFAPVNGGRINTNTGQAGVGVRF